VANSTAACSGGTCGNPCNAGYTACAGACVNYQTDSSNCGGCGAGYACASGFHCQSGICTQGFTYTPSNFNPASYTAPSGATTDCNATYSSTSHTFTAGSCTGTAPTIVSGVAQSGGPPLDILIFSSLTIASTSTLTLTGANPVIIAVYGSATIAGSVLANGAAGATNSSTAGASGPGGNYSCGASTQLEQQQRRGRRGSQLRRGQGCGRRQWQRRRLRGDGARQRFHRAPLRRLSGRQQR
jgi:hypothetical protein